MFSAGQIRQQFIDFFVNQGHKFVPSSPTVPPDDPTLLFANAGMNQFKDIFLGTGSRDYKRAVNSQKCIRAGGKHNDLEDVGTDTYHHTFFEMLGNWSFGDYFKTEAIEWAWKLLVEVWKLDPGRLHATYFEGDREENLQPDFESRQIWMKYLPVEHIHPGSKKDNFWEMGETGPCGPCSEIHYDGTDDFSGSSLVNTGSPKVIEIWNLVFIQFNRNGEGKLSPLPAKHVDTGMGLERIVRILQGKDSNYDTDLFAPIIAAIEKISGKKYNGTLNEKKDAAFRVIADHIRTLTFAITDGGVPSNEGRGYVIRRILRRACRFGRVLDMHQPFMAKLVPVVIEQMGEAFGEIKKSRDFLCAALTAEEESFNRTLDRGIEIFNSAAEKATGKTIFGDDAFALYDTYGFPLDLTQLMARERGMSVDVKKFEQLMEAQRSRARGAKKELSLAALISGVTPPATDDGQKYLTDSSAAKVIGFVDRQGYKDKGTLTEKNEQAAIILDKTCFYAESGGQTGDCGIIEGKAGTFSVENTEKAGNCILHCGKIVSGTISVGDDVCAKVDSGRQSSRKNHTATHLLQWALIETLGNSVRQQGSLVCPDYLRFDFTCPRALTPQEVKRVEHLVNEKIHANLPVAWAVMPIDKARKLAAHALFNEKYGDVVRVIAIGAESEEKLHEAFSREFCGGTHVENTGQIGGFKIIKEESISSGVRRITAITGYALQAWFAQRSEIIDDICEQLKTRPEEISVRIGKLIEENKKLAKDIKSVKKGGGTDAVSQAAELLAKSEKIGSTAIIIGRLNNASDEDVRGAIDMLRKKATSAAIVLGTAAGDDKVMLFAGMTDDLVKKGLSAGEIVKQIAPVVGGGGGGRPNMAQAGGKNAAKLDESLRKAGEIIKGKLKESPAK